MTQRDKTPPRANRSSSILTTNADSKQPLISYLHYPLDQVTDVGCSRVFYDKRVAQEVPGDSIGEEFNGYIFRITGGNDKQGFPMKQGVLLPYRVRLLLADGHSCFRPRRTGERRRKSVRGCIVGPDIAVLSLVVVKQGEQQIPGLTDTVLPKRLGPKRATKVRRFFNLKKEDDVRKFVIRREVTSKKKEGAKPYTKAYVPTSSSQLISPCGTDDCVSLLCSDVAPKSNAL